MLHRGPSRSASLPSRALTHSPRLSRPRQHTRRVAASGLDSSAGSTGETPAASAIAAGLTAFSLRRHLDATQRFTEALALSPTEEETRSALVNRACALTALSRFEEAAEDVRAAVNDHRLKYSVVAADADLAPLRASSAFLALAGELAGAGPGAGVGGAAAVRLRAEAKAPFRALRLFLLGGLGAGAALGGFVTAPALLKAVLVLPGAPDLAPTLRNAAVDLAVLVGCGALLLRENGAREAAEAVVAREEALGALPVRVATAAGAAPSASPLAAFRGSYRPLVLVAPRQQLRAAAKGAEPYRRELQARGLLLVLLDEEEAGAPAGAPPKARGFKPAAAEAPSAGGVGEAEARWKAPPADLPAWREWAARTRGAVTPPLAPYAPFYAAVGLDGTVAQSGGGVLDLDWLKVLDWFPKLEDGNMSGV